MEQNERSPAQLRDMFGANLRQLAAQHSSISGLARELKINRTQFNRYLSGESFPRPDVLARICSFFGVDARVLLEPVSQISDEADPFNMPFLRGFVGAGMDDVSEADFPDGFYRFARRSFVMQDIYFVGLNYLRRRGRTLTVKGFESRRAMQMQGFPTDAATREYRGLLMRQENGFVLMVSRRNAMTSSYNYLGSVAAFENRFWAGYSTRTVPETAGGLRATRLSYEYVGSTFKAGRAAARTCGFMSADELPPFHGKLIKPGEPFS
ncbi:MAG: helix-turn-helix transcriptional regulator [Sulfitobacter sp.]|nr:helix-turn-helix transcriptional regulator [Sulfitobacter sp.]